MKNYDQKIIKVFLYSSIPSWILVAAAYVRGSTSDWFNSLAGLVFISWLLTLFYIFIKMLFVTTFRETLLSKIVRDKILDERESIISGEAAKRGYFITIALIAILLFASTLKVTLNRPENYKKGTISLGLGYGFISKEALVLSKNSFSMKEFPITKEAMLTLLLVTQVISYRRNFRKRIEAV